MLEAIIGRSCDHLFLSLPQISFDIAISNEARCKFCSAFAYAVEVVADTSKVLIDIRPVVFLLCYWAFFMCKEVISFLM